MRRTASWQSPIVKFLSESESARRSRSGPGRGREPGVLPGRPSAARANAILARLRIDLGERLGRSRRSEPGTCSSWWTSRSSSPRRASLTYMHQPFVAPVDEDLPLLDSGARAVRGDPLRRDHERRRARLRQPAQPPLRRAAPDLRECIGYSEGGDRSALRLPAERPRCGRAAPRRLRLRVRSLGDGAGRGSTACAT